MKQVRLGNTLTLIPAIGVGTKRYFGGVEPLREAIKLGASLIDTSDTYVSERVVGEAIKGLRDRVFIAGRARPGRRDAVLKAAEASLRRLGIDYFDLYQMVKADKETIDAMETLVDRGVVKHIGASCFEIDDLRKARAAMKNYPIVFTAVEYHCLARSIEAKVLPYCRRNQITIIAYEPLWGGRLTSPSGFYAVDRQWAVRFAEFALRIRKTPAQIALNWCIAHSGVVAIPKSDSVARIAENCGAYGWQLPAEGIRLLDKGYSQWCRIPWVLR